MLQTGKAGGNGIAADRAAEQGLRDQVAHWRRQAFDAVLAQGRERDRIAAGLHDEIGQMLAMIGFKLGELGELPALAHHDQARPLLSEVRSLLRQSAQAVRTATFELSNPVLEQLGLKAALESVAQSIATGSALRVVIVGDAPRLAEPQRGVLYRVTRELLRNVQKHAQATQATVQLTTADLSHAGSGQGSVTVEVCDDGIGLDVRRAAAGCGPEGGFGLIHAHGQMQAIGGRLDVQRQPGGGTRAVLSLPWHANPGLSSEGRP